MPNYIITEDQLKELQEHADPEMKCDAILFSLPEAPDVEELRGLVSRYAELCGSVQAYLSEHDNPQPDYNERNRKREKMRVLAHLSSPTTKPEGD